MRTMMMAIAAAGLTVPAATLTVAAPAEAQRYYNGKTWYDGQGRPAAAATTAPPASSSAPPAVR